MKINYRLIVVESMEIYKYEQEKELEMLNISVKGLNLKLDWNTLKFCD